MGGHGRSCANRSCCAPREDPYCTGYTDPGSAGGSCNSAVVGWAAGVAEAGPWPADPRPDRTDLRASAVGVVAVAVYLAAGRRVQDSSRNPDPHRDRPTSGLAWRPLASVGTAPAVNQAYQVAGTASAKTNESQVNKRVIQK